MRLPSIALMLAASLCAACNTTAAKGRELGRVAKDWCLTIRASQVIPVYPLSEDVEPGDVYLVRTSIEDQIAVYESKGFLPLENLVVRLAPEGYAEFYAGGYGVDGTTRPPRHWQAAPPASSDGKPSALSNAWNRAPRAAFPSYTFTVERGQGLNLALPVQGVPVGLGLLNADKATGTIQISDAFTYGIGMFSLQEQVDRWAQKNADYLSQFAPVDPVESGAVVQYHYLRVIDRVYVTGGVDIALTDDSARGAQLDAGVPKAVSLPELAEKNTIENLDKINAALAKGVGGAPGGSIKLTSAAGRTVSLAETFPRPLVIGYIAFDLPILANGTLGPPVPTQTSLRGGSVLPAQPTPWGADDNTARISAWLKTDPTTNREKLRRWLDANGHSDGITNVIKGNAFRDVRAKAVDELEIP